MAHIMTIVSFTEYSASRQAKKFDSTHSMRFLHLGYLSVPLNIAQIKKIRGPSLPLIQQIDEHNYWRELSIAVTTQKVTFSYNKNDCSTSSFEMDRKRLLLQQEIRSDYIKPDFSINSWSPRQGIGFWVSGSWSGIRNVRIFPTSK